MSVGRATLVFVFGRWVADGVDAGRVSRGRSGTGRRVQWFCECRAVRRTESNMTNFLPGSGNHEIDQRGNELFVVAIGVIVIVLGLILMAIVLQAGGVVPHL
jgi:hypothetical protein